MRITSLPTTLRSATASTTRRPLLRSAGPRRALAAVVLVGSMLGLAACGGAEGGAPTQEGQGGQGAGAEASASAPADAQAQMPEPDLEGLPEVVATVDGEEISRQEFSAAYTAQFQQMAMQAQMSGQEMDQDQMKKQLAESMVGTELLVKDAEEQGLTASEEEVDAFLEKAATSSGLASVDELFATFKEQGYDEERLRADAQKQLLLDQSIERMDLPKPSEEEMRALYESSVTAQAEANGGGTGGGTGGDQEADTGGQKSDEKSDEKDGEKGGDKDAEKDAEKGAQDTPETPSFEELKPQLKQQLTAQQENEALRQRIEELRKDAEVTIEI